MSKILKPAFSRRVRVRFSMEYQNCINHPWTAVVAVNGADECVEIISLNAGHGQTDNWSEHLWSRAEINLIDDQNFEIIEGED